MAGGEQHLAPGVAHAVVGGDYAGDVLFHQVLRVGLVPEEGLHVIVGFQLVGGDGAHAVVRLGHHGIAHLVGEGQGGGQIRHRQAPGAGDARLLVVLLHGLLALVAADLMGLQTGGDVEVRPQLGVLLQPVLVVALHPVDLAVVGGEVAQGPQHLVVVLQGVHLVVLRQGGAQVRVQLIIGAVAHAQHVDAVLLQPDAEPPVGLREVGGNKHKIHDDPSLFFRTLQQNYTLARLRLQGVRLP